MVRQKFLKNLTMSTQLLSRNLTSALALPSSRINTSHQRLLSSSTSPSWQSSSHSVGGLEVEVGRLNPVEAPPRSDNSVNSVLAVHASGCSYKQWGKLGPLHSCPLLAPNLYGYGSSQPWPADRNPDIAGRNHIPHVFKILCLHHSWMNLTSYSDWFPVSLIPDYISLRLTTFTHRFSQTLYSSLSTRLFANPELRNVTDMADISV